MAVGRGEGGGDEGIRARQCLKIAESLLASFWAIVLKQYSGLSTESFVYIYKQRGLYLVVRGYRPSSVPCQMPLMIDRAGT